VLILPQPSRVDDILSRVTISRVWIALGGHPPKRNRASAFWRKTRDPNISLSDSKGAWYDFARGEGGGTLDLVCHVRGCDRKEALAWVADLAGVNLPDQPFTDADRRRWRVARLEAGALVRRKHELLAALRGARDAYLQGFHRANRYILMRGMDCTERVGLAADVAETYEARYQDFDRRIDLLAHARFSDLLPLFRAEKQERRAA
jgi:hypothetical protein